MLASRILPTLKALSTFTHLHLPVQLRKNHIFTLSKTNLRLPFLENLLSFRSITFNNAKSQIFLKPSPHFLLPGLQFRPNPLLNMIYNSSSLGSDQSH